MVLEEKRKQLDNREGCLERNERDQCLESQKREAGICEEENMLWIQEEDLNELGLKIKEAKSKLTSDQADLSKLAISERIFWIEIVNEFWNEWVKEDAIWDVALDGDYMIVLTENNRDVIAWQHKKQKTGNICVAYLISIIFGSYILCTLSWIRTMHKYFMHNL